MYESMIVWLDVCVLVVWINFLEKSFMCSSFFLIFFNDIDLEKRREKEI